MSLVSQPSFFVQISTSSLDRPPPMPPSRRAGQLDSTQHSWWPQKGEVMGVDYNHHSTPALLSGPIIAPTCTRHSPRQFLRDSEAGFSFSFSENCPPAPQAPAALQATRAPWSCNVAGPWRQVPHSARVVRCARAHFSLSCAELDQDRQHKPDPFSVAPNCTFLLTKLFWPRSHIRAIWVVPDSML